MGDQNLLSRVHTSEGTLSLKPVGDYWLQIRLHLQSIVPTPVSRRDDVRPVVKIIAESSSQHDEKHVPTQLSRIRVGRRRRWLIIRSVTIQLWCNLLYWWALSTANTHRSTEEAQDNKFLVTHLKSGFCKGCKFLQSHDKNTNLKAIEVLELMWHTNSYN
jgi:hypothetical protein